MSLNTSGCSWSNSAEEGCAGTVVVDAITSTVDGKVLEVARSTYCEGLIAETVKHEKGNVATHDVVSTGKSILVRTDGHFMYPIRASYSTGSSALLEMLRCFSTAQLSHQSHAGAERGDKYIGASVSFVVCLCKILDTQAVSRQRESLALHCMRARR